MLKDVFRDSASSLVVTKLAQANVSWNMRGAWLLQTGTQQCGPLQECYTDQFQLTLLLMVLCSAIFMMVCAFAFFREDKDEMFTPLTPQLVVKREAELVFHLPMDTQDENFAVTTEKGEVLVKVAMEWPPDPFRSGQSCYGTPAGQTGSVRIRNNFDVTIAVVVARNMSLALCRAAHEMFALVEPDGPNVYQVRHRTGYPLLTLQGEFGSGGVVDVEGINKDGAKICGVKDGRCWVLQHIDAGLIIASLLAVLLRRRLNEQPSPRQALDVSPDDGDVEGSVPAGDAEAQPESTDAPSIAEPPGATFE